MRRSRLQRQRHVWVPIAFLLIVGIVAPARFAGALATPTASCSVAAAGTTDLQIDWLPANGAVAYVIYRSVDGGPDH